MKTPFKFRAPAFDAQAINETIRTKLAAAGLTSTGLTSTGLTSAGLTGAGLVPKSGPMRGVTEVIRRSLASASKLPARNALVANENIIDVLARAVDGVTQSPRPKTRFSAQVAGASFVSHEFKSRAGTRAYKLYVPTQMSTSPALVVMLHGCTQSADDFAAGTRMNQLADEHGFLVVYPEQSSSANPSRCWNWFKTQDQVRDSGEPSLIVGIVQVVAARHNLDPRRMFVAGLSAGAAMAVILGETYPDIFAAVGVHSGLPYRSANDIPSAMLAMKGGRSGMPGLKTKLAGETAARFAVRHVVPTIVFHGDQDHTVQQSNAMEIVRQANDIGSKAKAKLTLNVEQGSSASGRSYTRNFYTDATGMSKIEHWTVHGAGHAWSGGDASGSYTDASGPDASAEMLRFFMGLS